MTGFNVLDPDLDLFQNHFLEASAGTGKTFAIENIVVRMLKAGIDIERILVVTFTRAATADLKNRIRKNIAKERLQEALFKFDEARIFTIHSFCFHSLREYALEADLSLEQDEEPSDENARAIIKDYLRTLQDVSPYQLEKLIRKGLDSLIDSILRYAQDRIPIDQGRSYEEISASLRALPFAPDKLFDQARFFGKMSNRQKMLKPEIEKELHTFVQFMEGKDVNIIDSPLLLMTRENKLKSAPEGYWEFLSKAVPLVDEISDELKILARLCEGARKKLEESEELSFEDLLCKMDQKVQEPHFAKKIRSQYDVVLIDEFQDTNPIQWRIFKTLFLNHSILYLVGDPKQAIYRFRHADIYTYMDAKRAFAKTEVLDTNYRSAPQVVNKLNELFEHLDIALPKTGEKIDYRPVKCDPNKNDQGAVFHLQAESEIDLFVAVLRRLCKPFSSNAVLVKDRYQAERFISFAKNLGFPAVSRRARSLLDSPAFPALKELIFAVLHPYNREAVLRVLGGQLYGWPLDRLEEENPFFDYKTILQKQGLFAFFRKWSADQGPALIARDESFYQDLLQLVEYLAEEEIALEELLPFLDQLKVELPARQNGEADAIQVLTTHVSKGLEFETVFPIGLILPAVRRRELVVVDGCYQCSEKALQMHHAELDAEEMRQLYVAFTRAKKQLYILSLREGRGPINRFLAKAHFPPEEVTGEELPKAPEEVQKEIVEPREISRKYKPVVIDSFSSLFAAKSNKVELLPSTQRLPSGAEFGTWLHDLLEQLPFHEYEKKLSSLIQSSPLKPYHDEVYTLIEKALTTPLPNLCALVDIAPNRMIKEMEFLYKTERGYMKGFIDLFFEHEERFYFLDWKSNLVDNLELLMKRNHYDEQAKIYQEASMRYLKLFPNKSFGGSFYLFLRYNQVVVL